jgi:hypothetical protein
MRKSGLNDWLLILRSGRNAATSSIHRSFVLLLQSSKKVTNTITMAGISRRLVKTSQQPNSLGERNGKM